MKRFAQFLFRIEHLIGRELKGFELANALACFDAGANADEVALRIHAQQPAKLRGAA